MRKTEGQKQKDKIANNCCCSIIVSDVQNTQRYEY